MLSRFLDSLTSKGAASSGRGISSTTPNLSDNTNSRTMASSTSPEPMSKAKSDQEWRTVLNKEQFRILREKGTEAASTGKYDKHYDDGVYTCAACDTPLYKSTTKFKSGCGWPAFFEALPGAVTRTEDRSMFSTRTEITCTACGGHLGHVFKGEGFKTPTDERHCVNSISMKFSPEDPTKAK